MLMACCRPNVSESCTERNLRLARARRALLKAVFMTRVACAGGAMSGRKDDTKSQPVMPDATTRQRLRTSADTQKGKGARRTYLAALGQPAERSVHEAVIAQKYRGPGRQWWVCAELLRAQYGERCSLLLRRRTPRTRLRERSLSLRVLVRPASGPPPLWRIRVRHTRRGVAREERNSRIKLTEQE